VVPPGIEKTPDQAARISQSVDFGHLSDILTFFGVPHFLTLFLSHFGFSVLSLFWFLHFVHFYDFLILVIFSFSPFLPLFVIRPYYGVNKLNLHFLVHKGRSRIYVWWFSPHLNIFIFDVWSDFSFDQDVGEITQGSFNNILSFSPLWTGVHMFCGSFDDQDVGEITQESRVYLNSRSPLYNFGEK